jgi:hypothetical protein
MFDLECSSLDLARRVAWINSFPSLSCAPLTQPKCGKNIFIDHIGVHRVMTT